MTLREILDGYYFLHLVLPGGYAPGDNSLIQAGILPRPLQIWLQRLVALDRDIALMCFCTARDACAFEIFPDRKWLL